MISVSRYTEVNMEQWNDFIGIAKNGIFLFDRGYMDYHKDRYPDHSLMVYKRSKIIAAFVASEDGQNIISHGGLTFGGLVLHYDVSTADVLDMVGKLYDYYKISGFKSLVYKTIPFLFHKYPASEDLYALFRHHATLIRRDVSSVVELGNPIRFSETKRQSVGKCAKMGIEVTENCDFSRYWTLLSEVLARYNARPVHNLKEISMLRDRFPGNIKLYEAISGGELLAGVVIYDYGKTVHTQYMANSTDGRKIGALDFVNSFLINEVFKDRQYYSLGTSMEQKGGLLNEGLIQQKEMMGGRSVVYDFYKMDLI
jgi:hypothetical protein